MISYEPFYQTLLKKNITEYHLIYKEGISANTLYRIKKGLPITTKTLDTLCFILDCEVTLQFHQISTEKQISAGRKRRRQLRVLITARFIFYLLN